MRHMKLPHADREGLFVRIRPDRIDVVDEVEEEYETEESVAAREAVRQTNLTTVARHGSVGRSSMNLEPEPAVATRRVTLVYVQGRRNPWRVSTPAADVEHMHYQWSQFGRFDEFEEDEDDDGR